MSIIASVSDELKFHQWPDGSLQQSYSPIEKCEKGHIQSISWSKDGTWVVLVPNSGSTEIVSIKENVKLLQTIQDVCYPKCAAFQNNTKKHIAVGTLSGQILIYDIKSRNFRKRFPRVSSPVFKLEYNYKDTHIAAGCATGEILLFNNTNMNLSATYKVPNSDNVSAINFHRSRRNILAAGSEEGIIAVWDINTNALQFNMMAHQAPVTDLKLSPLRSDLLVTSGLDRRFTFFDFVNKKRLLEVDVSSSITSLDFSHCGFYLGLGGQNGNIVMYDTRNLAKPISAFEAHSGKRIHQLLFQKVLLPSDQQTNSFYDISMAEPIENQPLREKLQETNGSPCGFDLTGLINYNVSNTQMNTNKDGSSVRRFSNEAGDSFLVAMGLDGSTQSEASSKLDGTSGLGITEGVKKWMDESKRVVLPHSESQKNVLPLTPAPSLKQMSSTPKYFIPEELPSNIVSPIISGNQTIPTEIQAGTTTQQLPMLKEDMKKLIKEVFQEEMKDQLEAYKEEVKGEFTEALFHIRSYFLNLHMLLVKEFVKMESILEKMNASKGKQYTCDDYIANQNQTLPKELQALKEHLVEKDQMKY